MVGLGGSVCTVGTIPEGGLPGTLVGDGGMWEGGNGEGSRTGGGTSLPSSLTGAEEGSVVGDSGG